MSSERKTKMKQAFIWLAWGLILVSGDNIQEHEMCHKESFNTIPANSLVRIKSPANYTLLPDIVYCSFKIQHQTNDPFGFSPLGQPYSSYGEKVWTVDYDIKFPEDSQLCSSFSALGLQDSCNGRCTNLFLRESEFGQALVLADMVNGSTTGKIKASSPIYVTYCIDLTQEDKPVFDIEITEVAKSPEKNNGRQDTGSDDYSSYTPHAAGSVAGGGGVGVVVIFCFCARRRRRLVAIDTVALPVSSGGAAPATGQPTTSRSSQQAPYQPIQRSQVPDPSIRRPRPVPHQQTNATTLLVDIDDPDQLGVSSNHPNSNMPLVPPPYSVFAMPTDKGVPPPPYSTPHSSNPNL